ncbi:MAG: glycoside hydrolase family 57 protein [Candidatus Woesebacteria bacterium]|jgi:alpha-amylase
MPQICLYFQLHQPYRLQNFEVFDLGNNSSYFFSEKNDLNRLVFQKVANKSYLPMLRLLNDLLHRHDNFKFALSCSGVFLEQALFYEKEIIQLIKDAVKTGRLELLSETYYHSLAFLYSKDEFIHQVDKHRNLIKKLFNFETKVFRNTELIYANEIIDLLDDFDFLGVLTEAVDRYLQGRTRTQLFASQSLNKVPLLLKHAKLSDDLAFRFSNRSWLWYPLTVDRYLEWIQIYPEESLVNLFMDFETFGEHQWVDTGIFDFFAELIKRFLDKSWNHFVLPSEIFKQYAVKQRSASFKLSQKKLNKLAIYDVPDYISWADIDRDLTAWRDNQFQYDSLRILYSMEDKILNSNNEQLVEDWRRLQTSDHFYYMCTKWAADGDVHAYFNPYKSPFEAYRKYSIVLADLRERLL